MSNTPNLCPCGSQQKYTICCGKFHKGKLYAPTAEALMRSRYSAYVLDNPQYIYRTWDEDTRPTLQSLRDGKTENFISLKILSTKDGGTSDTDGIIEFVAKFKSGDDLFEHHENSAFRRVKKHWVYVGAI